MYSKRSLCYGGSHAEAPLKLAFFMLFCHFAVFVQYLQLYFRGLGYGDAQVGLLMGLIQASGVGGALLLVQ